MKKLFVIVIALLISSGLRAEIVLAESENFIVVCVKSPICSSVEQADIAQREARAASLAQEADAILTWFGSLEYPELRLDTKHGKFMLTVFSDGVCHSSTAVACHKTYDMSYGYRSVFLPGYRFLSGEISGDTLAHELSHGLDEFPSRIGADTIWLGEAMASAIGTAWARRTGSLSGELGRIKSLDLPFNLGTDQGYEKFDYLEEVGLALGSLEMVKYLGEFFTISEAQNQGMSYLYDRVEDQTFDEIYPIYVASFNNMETTWPNAEGEKTAEGDYYNTFETKPVSINHASGNFSISYDFNVLKFASDPVFFNPIKVLHAADDEAKDVLMVAEFEITTADDLDATQLVFEHRVGQNRQVRYLFSGLNPIEGGFVRVTNAARNIDDNKAQNYRLELRASPVEFELPKCMAVNSSMDISLITGSLSGVNNWELRPSAGSIDGMVFTSPSTPGDVEIDLLITSHITRSETGINPATPEVTTVSLGTIPVKQEMCHIRMRMTSDGQAMTVTYAPTPDYSEILAPEGVKLYLSASRLAMFEPSSGWLPIPAGAGAMMMGQIQGMMALSTPPPWARGEDLLLYRTPLMFSQWFDWESVTDVAYPGIVKSRIGTPVACPVSSGGCVSILAAGTSLIYNEQRQIEQILQGPDIGTFEYGSFNIGTPPGW